MKTHVFGALIWFALADVLSSQTISVFGKNEITLIDASGAVTALSDSPAHLSFLAALRRRGTTGNYESRLTFAAPPEWGKTLVGAGGFVRFQPRFPQGLATQISLQGLAPNHAYLLTLNGTPHTPGNERLPDPVPGLPEERFYDFLRIVTNAEGAYEADLGIYLLPGDYHVRIYVKDTDDFKIVLYRDYFDFTVMPDSPVPAKTSVTP